MPYGFWMLQKMANGQLLFLALFKFLNKTVHKTLLNSWQSFRFKDLKISRFESLNMPNCSHHIPSHYAIQPNYSETDFFGDFMILSQTVKILSSKHLSKYTFNLRNAMSLQKIIMNKEICFNS